MTVKYVSFKKRHVYKKIGKIKKLENTILIMKFINMYHKEFNVDIKDNLIVKDNIKPLVFLSFHFFAEKL